VWEATPRLSFERMSFFLFRQKRRQSLSVFFRFFPFTPPRTGVIVSSRALEVETALGFVPRVALLTAHRAPDRIGSFRPFGKARAPFEIKETSPDGSLYTLGPQAKCFLLSVRPPLLFFTGHPCRQRTSDVFFFFFHAQEGPPPPWMPYPCTAFSLPETLFRRDDQESFGVFRGDRWSF